MEFAEELEEAEDEDEEDEEDEENEARFAGGPCLVLLFLRGLETARELFAVGGAGAGPGLRKALWEKTAVVEEKDIEEEEWE